MYEPCRTNERGSKKPKRAGTEAGHGSREAVRSGSKQSKYSCGAAVIVQEAAEALSASRRRSERRIASARRNEPSLRTILCDVAHNTDVPPRILPKLRIGRPAKGNGICADSNLLAKPNGFSP